MGAYSSPAYWNGNVYYWGQYDYLKSFALVSGLLTQSSSTSNEEYTYRGATLSISANGSTQGRAWTIDASAFGTAGPAILQAHDANNVATTLYSSATNTARDSAGPAVRFALPTIANGKVYVGAANELDFYGLLNASTRQARLPSLPVRNCSSALSASRSPMFLRTPRSTTQRTERRRARLDALQWTDFVSRPRRSTRLPRSLD